MSAFYLKGHPQNQQISFNLQHDFSSWQRARCGWLLLSLSHCRRRVKPRGQPKSLNFGPAFTQVAHSEHQLILGGKTDRKHKNPKIIRHETESYCEWSRSHLININSLIT